VKNVTKPTAPDARLGRETKRAGIQRYKKVKRGVLGRIRRVCGKKQEKG
jgi:hypothetical protein